MKRTACCLIIIFCLFCVNENIRGYEGGQDDFYQYDVENTDYLYSINEDIGISDNLLIEGADNWFSSDFFADPIEEEDIELRAGGWGRPKEDPIPDSIGFMILLSGIYFLAVAIKKRKIHFSMTNIMTLMKKLTKKQAAKSRN